MEEGRESSEQGRRGQSGVPSPREGPGAPPSARRRSTRETHDFGGEWSCDRCAGRRCGGRRTRDATPENRAEPDDEIEAFGSGSSCGRYAGPYGGATGAPDAQSERASDSGTAEPTSRASVRSRARRSRRLLRLRARLRYVGGIRERVPEPHEEWGLWNFCYEGERARARTSSSARAIDLIRMRSDDSRRESRPGLDDAFAAVEEVISGLVPNETVETVSAARALSTVHVKWSWIRTCVERRRRSCR
jgi:hypothetical protein